MICVHLFCYDIVFWFLNGLSLHFLSAESQPFSNPATSNRRNQYILANYYCCSLNSFHNYLDTPSRADDLFWRFGKPSNRNLFAGSNTRFQLLTDLNDFITPSQACIKPVESKTVPVPDPSAVASVSQPLDLTARKV
jgi:hypothetical protein